MGNPPENQVGKKNSGPSFHKTPACTLYEKEKPVFFLFSGSVDIVQDQVPTALSEDPTGLIPIMRVMRGTSRSLDPH